MRGNVRYEARLVLRGRRGTSRSPILMTIAVGSLVLGSLLAAGTSSASVTLSGAGTSGSATATCKTPIKIGVAYLSEAQAASSSAGASQQSSQSLNQQAQAATQAQRTLIAWINQHGGLGPDCQVVGGYHAFHVLGQDGFAAETQAECSDFAEDQHVNIVISTSNETSGLIPCLAQKHVVVFFQSADYSPSPSDFSKYRGYLYQPGLITTSRWGPFVDVFNQAGYFGPYDASNGSLNGAAATPCKAAILIADDGTNHNKDLAKIWAPLVAKRCGNTKPLEFTFTESDGTASSEGTLSQQFSSAVLAMRAAGVNHVIVTPDGSNVLFYFLPQAKAEQYYPRYGLTTGNGITVWSLGTPQELSNAVAVSYTPFDTGENGGFSNPNYSQYNSNPTTPGMRQTKALCRSVFAGHMPSGVTNIDTLYGTCDQFFWIYDALKGATSLTPQNLPQVLLAGTNKLGCSYSPAAAYLNPCVGEPDHYDGGMGVRGMKWDNSTSSWIYATPVVRIPQGS